MKSTNRKWQNHLKCKGLMPFFMDRVVSWVCASSRQFEDSPFNFPVDNRDLEDEISRAYFEWVDHFPHEVCIEITNRCNLECIMCYRDRMTRPEGIMGEALFKKIVDEIAEKQPLTKLSLYHLGEALVDKNFFNKVAYARERGLTNTGLSTNGQLLLERDNYKKLAEAGLSIIYINIDGFRPETYERIRVGGSFEKVIEGVQKLKAYILADPSIHTRLELKYLIYNDINDSEEEVQSFIDWCEENDHEYNLDTLFDWAGRLDSAPKSKDEVGPDPHNDERECPCGALWQTMVIDWDGRVPLCFDDGDLDEQMGDITRETIEDIWTTALFEKRRKHVQGNLDGLCANCRSFSGVTLPKFNSPLYPPAYRAADKDDEAFA